MRTLYPELACFATDHLTSGDGHHVYFEQSGDPQGVPIIFLHGGPGSGCNEKHRRYFDPQQYRIIIFDQRGCNRSMPNGCVTDNTTQLLLADMESIRKSLNLSKWVLFGGSWGSTLALLYAQSYPQYVSGMILRGSFLARSSDLNWFLKHGVNQIFPEYWQEFVAGFSANEQECLEHALYTRIFSDDAKMQLETARAWALWSGRVVTHSLDLPEPYALDEDDDEQLLNTVRIEMHYAKHQYFISENQILDHVSDLPDVPVTLLHGRRDLTCLPQSSWALHKRIAGSKLHVLPTAGHLTSEPVMVDALVSASVDILSVLEG